VIVSRGWSLHVLALDSLNLNLNLNLKDINNDTVRQVLYDFYSHYIFNYVRIVSLFKIYVTMF